MSVAGEGTRGGGLRGRNQGKGGLFFAAVMVLAGVAQGATPVLYDDFGNAAVSNGFWVKETSGAGSVTFTGGQAVLDMSSPTVGKSARMLFPGTLPAELVAGDFRVTWDQQLVGDNLNAFVSGFAMRSGTTMVLYAGQAGRQNDGAFANPFFPHHYTVYGGSGTGTFGTVDGGTSKAHFDLSIAGGAVTLGVYAYDGGFDGSPDSYVTSGTLRETIHETLTGTSASMPLTLLFFSEGVTGTDGFAQTRGVISVDNVFVSVPEAGTVGVLGLGVVGLVGRRRRGRGVMGD